MRQPQVVSRDGERIVHANGVELCVETFGERSDPAILLLSGAAYSMDWWEDEFCRKLAGGERFVIRYDYRDTGCSIGYEPGLPPYGFDDLVVDAVGLLDCVGVERAHVVGFSMGGGIAQRLALDHDARVASLTLISTSPGLRPAAAPRLNLPPPSATVLAYLAATGAAPVAMDRAAAIDSIVAVQRLFAGSTGSREAHFRRLAARVVDRTADITASLNNHWLIDPGAPYASRLGEITTATLVVHGTEDPLFSYAHAEALAREITSARLLALEGVGHHMPPEQTWDVVVSAVLDHTRCPSGVDPGTATHLTEKRSRHMSEAKVLLTGLVIGESPRWHEGRLWLSNWGAQEVIAVDAEGNSEVMAKVPTTIPFSIDWLPEGHLLVTCGPEERLLRQESDGSLVDHADLSGLAFEGLNEIVVDGRGNIYINGGCTFEPGEGERPGGIALITPDGSVRQVADEIAFPNGMVVTPDNSTLIISESFAGRLTAFDIGDDGGLSNRRVWADGVGPDGICIDTEGAIWTGVGQMDENVVGRVREGGEVLERVQLDLPCFACMLGGPDGRTLFMVANDWRIADHFTDNLQRLLTGPRTGQVLTATAPAPGAGWP